MTFGDFESYFHCTCAEIARILLSASNLTTPFDPTCPNRIEYNFIRSNAHIIYIFTIIALNRTTRHNI
jgi:hypothetical protein